MIRQMERFALLLLLLLFPITAFAQTRISTFAGTGQAGYAGDGGPALKAQFNNPFGVVRGPDGALYVSEYLNHVIRKIDRRGVVTTVAGTGRKGYAGDGGPALQAELDDPHEVRFDKQGNLFFVEPLNHVVRRVDAQTQIITTVAGTGERKPTPDGARLAEAPLNGPRSMDFDRQGDLWLVLREGNAVYRLALKAGTIHHVAGTGEKGFTGNGGPAKLATLSGPKGVSVAPNGNVYLADTENHALRMIDVRKGTLELIAGTGEKGDGADGAPLQCKMARPHGVFVDKDGSIFIGDSEAHRVRVIR